MRWLDLSAHSLKLVVATLPSGNHVLVLEGAEKHVESAQRLGFERVRGGVWIKRGTQFSPAAFIREFPQGRIAEVDPRDYTVSASRPAAQAVPRPQETPATAAAQPEPAQAAAPPAAAGGEAGPQEPDAASERRPSQAEDAGNGAEATAQQSSAGPSAEQATAAPRPSSAVSLAQSYLLGLNRLGQSVFEGPEGRFLRDARDRVTFERDLNQAAPGLFLRAPTEEALAMSAEGFVEEAAEGRILRTDDLMRFVRAVYAEDMPLSDPRVGHACMAIEGAAARWLARKGGNSMRDLFGGAAKLHESLNFLGAVRRAHPQASSGLPFPVAVAAQRILGTEADLIGKTIAIPRAGTGSVFAHMPHGATLRVYEPDPARLVHARATAAAAGIRSSVFSDAPVSSEGADLVVSVLERGLLADPKAVDGIAVSRSDLAEIIDSLEERSFDGRSVFLLQGADTPEEEEEMERVRSWIGARYAIEGTVDVDGALHCGSPDAAPLRMLVVGRRRPEPLDEAPEAALRLRQVYDFGSLWTWTAEVVANRAKVEDFYTAEPDVEVGGGDPDLVRNEFQTPYVPASRVGTATTMVPRNIEGALREALGKVARKHRDIDQWVANELAMTREQLAAAFSPEQVDALALQFDAEDRGRAFLLADQTGVGKGRIIAGRMRRAALQGRKILFLTERATNLSDIWRDVVHIGSEGEFSPLILNAGATVIDEATDETVMKAAPRNEVAALMETGEWSPDHNLILSTYSQFNRDAEASAKSAWITQAIDQDTVVILDECHNAAGSSNISKNVTAAVDAAANTLYSSATWAKTAKNVGFYAPLFPDGLSVEELATIMRKGGETLQEVVSTMLVQDGVMIRREHDLSNVEFETVRDEERFDRNRQYMDILAPILAEMAYMSGDINQRVNRMNERIEQAIDARLAAGPARPQAQVEAARRRQMKSLQVSRVGFGSPLYNLSRLFVASLKLDKTVEEALRALRNNEKPVILVENTIQGVLEELAAQEDEIEGTALPDFKALMRRALRQLTMITRRENGETIREDVTENDPALRAAVDNIRNMIDVLPDLPSSAIDVVRERLAAEGYACDEITGRTYECRDGRIVRRAAVDKTVIKNRFNAGDLDALVVNAAGCTGIDLHAGARFADQRRRVLIPLQPPADISKEIQALGRVNRYDQVVGPRITSILSGLPIEIRLDGMRNARLRRLSANVSANRDNSALIRDIPDLINSVGDTVCTRYAEARPDLMRRLGFEVTHNAEVEAQNADQNQGEDATDNRRSANTFLARLIMLPVGMQEQVMNELTAEFKATIEEMEARGDAPLRTKEIKGTVHVRRRSVFEGADLERHDSAFHAPVHLLNVQIERNVDSLSSADVTRLIEESALHHSPDSAEARIDDLLRHREEILAAYLPLGVGSVRDALATGVASIVDRNNRLDQLIEAVRNLSLGRQVSFSHHDETLQGIVTRIDYPRRGYEHNPYMYVIDVAVPGDIEPRFMTLHTLLRDEAFAIDDGLEGEAYDEILDNFDKAVASRTFEGMILATNIFRGMQLNVEHKLGTLVAFENDGQVHRGILVSNKHRSMDFLPVVMSDPDMAADAFLQARAELRGSSDLSVRAIVLSRLKDDIVLTLPHRRSRKYNFIYEHPPIEALLERNEARGNSAPRITLDADEVHEVLGHLSDAGVKFYTSGKHRKWANEYLAELHAGEDLDQDTPDMHLEGAQV